MRVAKKHTETNNLFEILADKVPVALYIVQDAQFRYVNLAFQNITGYKKEELLGRNSLGLVVPEDREMVRRNAIGMLKGKSSLPYEFRVINKDGSTKWVSESVVSIQYRGRQATLGYFVDVTEHKQIEEALQTEKNKLQSLIDAIEYTITIQDAEYNIVFQNEKSKIASGGDHVGEKCYRAYEGRDRVCEGCPVEKAFKDGKSHTAERKTVISGKVALWENTASPIRDARGRIILCVEVARDITERKKMEETLRESREQLKNMFESVSDGISVIDLNGIIREVNERTVEMHGFDSKDELIGKSAFELIGPGDREKVAEHIKKVLKLGLRERLECNMLRANGTGFPGELSASALKDASGRLVGHISICRDITERKKMEEALKLAAEEWQKTFDSISDAICIISNDLRIERANKAFADLFHMEISQVIGKHCYELHKRPKPIAGCPGRQTLATKKPAVAEFYESNLGKFLLESTSPVFNDQNEVVATVHITRDITAQKQQSQRLMMADRLASIGELAAGTAHELNNPLTSIIGFSQLLRDNKNIPDDIRGNVELIYSQAQRAASVTQNLLAFARKHTPMKQLSQINNIIEDVLKLRAYELKLNGIEVKKQLASDLPEIMVDYFQMQQVFLNIITNAEYFMIQAHGKGTLTITTERRNSKVVISIADDGPGIPPENLSRIFDPFFTTKPVGKGTGLGLSICHGIVTEHGGQIYAVSELGKGATIVVELPINHSQPFPGIS